MLGYSTHLWARVWFWLSLARVWFWFCLALARVWFWLSLARVRFWFCLALARVWFWFCLALARERQQVLAAVLLGSQYRSADQRRLRNIFILHLELLYVVFLQRHVKRVFYSSDGGAVEQLHESPAASRQPQRVRVEDDVMSHAAVSGGVPVRSARCQAVRYPPAVSRCSVPVSGRFARGFIDQRIGADVDEEFPARAASLQHVMRLGVEEARADSSLLLQPRDLFLV